MITGSVSYQSDRPSPSRSRRGNVTIAQHSMIFKLCVGWYFYDWKLMEELLRFTISTNMELLQICIFYVSTFSSTFKPAVLSVYLHYHIWVCLEQLCNIILCWFPDNTAGIVTRRSGFQQRVQDVYVLPVVVEDSGYPAQSSTTTLTIRVCSCEAGGSLLTCSAEAIFLPVGLSTGALMAILLCVTLLIGKFNFYLSSSFFCEMWLIKTPKSC